MSFFLCTVTWNNLRKRSSEMDQKGLFITFEGGEASGKSTQTKLLTNRLKASGRRVYLTKEPGGTELGKRLREILKYSEEPIDQATEVALFMADRLHHVPTIRTEMLAGKVVVCDRYSDSTRAYQCFGRDCPNLEETLMLIAMSERGLIPDRTYYLRLGVFESIERMKYSETHNSRFDKESPQFHQRVLEGFDHQAYIDKQRFLVVDASPDPEAIADEIWDDFVSHFSEGR